jgi:AcrR family transcriptional regulator
MTRRTYTSEVRARAARETRAAILRAAGGLFAEQGYARTSVAAIAARAGVALNTVYTSVGGKSALIEALVRDGTADTAIDAALAEMLTLTDGARILRLLAESTGEVTRRQAVTLRVLLDNATSDPAVAAAADLAVRRYRDRLGRIAAHLIDVGAVRTDVTRTEQILWFYFGTASWTTVRELGWGWPEAAAWLADQSAAALLVKRTRG